MSEKRARFVGHPDGASLTVPVATEGEPPKHVTVAYGDELPAEIDGHKVPAAFRDSLLEQSDSWTTDTKAKTKKKEEGEDG